MQRTNQSLLFGSVVSLEGYDYLIDWPQAQANPSLKTSNSLNSRGILEDCDEESEGVQSKERWAYVKVNMDGVVVGRKVCILDHGGYSSLARQLEDMFGRFNNLMRTLKITNFYNYLPVTGWFVQFFR